MSAAGLATLIAIIAVIVAAIPIYFMAKSNARENARAQEKKSDADVKAAVDPVIVQRDDARRQRDEAVRERDRLTVRVEQLEDELRRMR